MSSSKAYSKYDHEYCEKRLQELAEAHVQFKKVEIFASPLKGKDFLQYWQIRFYCSVILIQLYIIQISFLMEVDVGTMLFIAEIIYLGSYLCYAFIVVLIRHTGNIEHYVCQVIDAQGGIWKMEFGRSGVLCEKLNGKTGKTWDACALDIDRYLTRRYVATGKISSSQVFDLGMEYHTKQYEAQTRNCQTFARDLMNLFDVRLSTVTNSNILETFDDKKEFLWCFVLRILASGIILSAFYFTWKNEEACQHVGTSICFWRIPICRCLFIWIIFASITRLWKRHELSEGERFCKTQMMLLYKRHYTDCELDEAIKPKPIWWQSLNERDRAAIIAMYTQGIQHYGMLTNELKTDLENKFHLVPNQISSLQGIVYGKTTANHKDHVVDICRIGGSQLVQYIWWDREINSCYYYFGVVITHALWILIAIFPLTLAFIVIPCFA